VSFNWNATAGRVETLIRNLTFVDNSDDPAATQSLTFKLAGVLRTDVVTVTGVNDPPVLDLDADDSGATGTGYAATFISNGAPVAGYQHL
jgi:hypothetical protein